MVRSLATPWLIRAFAWRDWARYSEKHGSPLVKASVPMVGDAADKADFFDKVRALSTETTVMLPQGATPGESFDLSLLEATANTWEGFERLITACNVSYAVRVLGQNLTTEVQGGSFAAAKVSDDVRTDIKQNDAEGLYALAREQILPLTVEANYGAGAPVPGPSYAVEPAADRGEQATAIKTFGEALSALKTAGIKPTNIDELAEQYGLEVEEVEPPPPPPVIASPFAPRAPVDAMPDAMPEDAATPSAGTDEEAMADRIVLASGAPIEAAPGFVSGQLYVDALATDGVRRSVRAFSPDLAAVKQIIESCTSFDECRSKLLNLYRDLDANVVMRLLERAFILGDLAGQWSVQRDL
jgi:phage gp29-like protein